MKYLIITLFVVLLGGALYFSFERILFCDASFILFRIINTGWFQIQEYRYGAAATQAFPFVGVKLGLPLAWIVVLYSASFNIFYLAVAVWLIRCKEYSMAILMSFFFLLLVSDAFYWTNNEIYQAVAWMFLFFSSLFLMARKKAPQWVVIPIFSLLGFFTIYTHPLIVFSFGFLWVFYTLQPTLWPYSRKFTLILSSILILIAASRFWVSLSYSRFAYDAEKMQGLIHLDPASIMGVFGSPMAKEFASRCLTNYWLLPLIAITGFVSGLLQKKYLLTLFAIGCTLGYFVIMCLSFHEFIPYYSESEWASFTIIATAPFVYFTLPKIRERKVVWMLGVIFMIRLGYIAASSEKFVRRKEWIYATLDDMRKNGITKAVIYESPQTRELLLENNWSQPSESFIASALHDDKPNLTFVVDKPENIRKRMPHRNEIILDFETGEYEWMNQKYFSFDTTQNYQVLWAE